MEVKWRLSRWERNPNGYFTLHFLCFLCLFDWSHNRQTGSSAEMCRSLIGFGGRDGTWQSFCFPPAGAAWVCAELTTTAVPAGVYSLGLVRMGIFGSVCCQQCFHFNSLLIALGVLHSSSRFCTAAASAKAKGLKVYYVVPRWVMRRFICKDTD